ncbi:MAG: FadR family transcriptional regulator [Chloroflexi bacterium]|nr:FadR family transcriptional regulator [Chloroflexota bacterium]
MTGFARLDRRRAFEAIVDQVRDAILGGRYRVGERLPPERELAAQFGVARHAVREAVRVLEHAGLVRVRRGAQGGTFVAAARAEASGHLLAAVMDVRGFSVSDLFRAKLLLEPAVAEQAATEATDAELAALADVLAREASALAESGDAYVEFAEFHARLAAILENPLLVEMLSALERSARLLHHAAGPGDSVYRQVHHEHQGILDAVRHRRAADARSAMAEHLKTMETRYLKSVALVERRGEAAGDPGRRRSRSA